MKYSNRLIYATLEYLLIQLREKGELADTTYTMLHDLASDLDNQVETTENMLEVNTNVIGVCTEVQMYVRPLTTGDFTLYQQLTITDGISDVQLLVDKDFEVVDGDLISFKVTGLADGGDDAPLVNKVVTHRVMLNLSQVNVDNADSILESYYATQKELQAQEEQVKKSKVIDESVVNISLGDIFGNLGG